MNRQMGGGSKDHKIHDTTHEFSIDHPGLEKAKDAVVGFVGELYRELFWYSGFQ